VVLVAGEAVASLPPSTLWLMTAGGILYTIGVVFHLWETLPYQNAIWHLHVLVATACFYAAIVMEVL
jgi:hemolysin III